MLETEVSGVFAESEQEMVVAIVARAEKRTGFGDEFAVGGFGFRLHGQIRCAIGGDVDFVRDVGAGRQRYHAEKLAGENRRVDQSSERSSVKGNGVARLLRARQRGAEFPARR